MILRPFFETTLWFAIKKYNQNEIGLLNEVSEFLKNVLTLPDVQDTNKIIVVQVLDSIIFVTELNSQVTN